MVICLERGANDLHMAQLMIPPPHRLLLGLTFLVPAYPGCRGKEVVKLSACLLIFRCLHLSVGFTQEDAVGECNKTLRMVCVPAAATTLPVVVVAVKCCFVVACSSSHGCRDRCSWLFDSQQCVCNKGRRFNGSTSTCVGQFRSDLTLIT